MKETQGKWIIQIGKNAGSYKTKYTFDADKMAQAMLYYKSLNVGYGFKKRLIDPKGKVINRVMTSK